MTAHPLDRVVWSAFSTRQSDVARIEDGALRVHPDIGLFGATADNSPASLAALGPPIPGTRVVQRAVLWQMVADTLADPRPASFTLEPLTEADAPDMLALATQTRPGPFFSKTHELGDFFGVKVDGRLAAMAGERMRPVGFTEVSGVCADPGHRGQGYAAALMLHVAHRIMARGETPFLHSYADNAGAIALYQSLGFRFRCEQILTVLAAD
jgi:predicted GNAT family acetyltransferase